MPRSFRSEPLNERLLRKWPLPRVDPRGTKESRGGVLIVGGDAEMPGAVILAATAALRAGAGKLRVATVRSVAPLVAALVPEALVMGLPQTRKGEIAPSAARELAKSAQDSRAVLIGPGMVDAARFAGELLPRLAKQRVVLDAGALQPGLLPAGEVAITPHAGEMAHLLGVSRNSVEADPAATALRAAKELRVAVALKGAETFIAGPDGRLLCNRDAGNAGLGTSGSGDTLSGIVAGLAARGVDLLQALAWGVFLHGRAGDVLARKVGPLGYLPRELLAEVPREMARLSRR
jgi:ADP-dependent NAD(P)H-hydrate dehydratase